MYIEEEDILADDANVDTTGRKIHKRLVHMDTSSRGRGGRKVVTTGQALSSGAYAGECCAFTCYAC